MPDAVCPNTIAALLRRDFDIWLPHPPAPIHDVSRAVHAVPSIPLPADLTRHWTLFPIKKRRNEHQRVVESTERVEIRHHDGGASLNT